MTERWVKYTDEKNITRWVNMSHAAVVTPNSIINDDHATIVLLLKDLSGRDVILAKEPPEHFLPAESAALDADWGEQVKSITLDPDTLRTGYCEKNKQIILDQGETEILIPESMFDKLFDQIRQFHLRREHE